MAYAKRRVGIDGKVRYTAIYVDPRGRERSAGTYDGKRAAEKAAHLAEGTVASGEWIDPANARMTFREYAEGYWWPSKHLEVNTRVTYRTCWRRTCSHSSARCRWERSCRRLSGHGWRRLRRTSRREQ